MDAAQSVGGKIRRWYNLEVLVLALSPLTKLEMEHNKKRERSMLILFGKK